MTLSAFIKGVPFLAVMLSLVAGTSVNAQTRPMVRPGGSAQGAIAPTAGAGAAANKVLKIDKIDGRKVQTPEYSVKRFQGDGAKVKEWFEVSCQYQTAPEWVDELRFQYHILLKGKPEAPGQSPYSLFRGEVNYVNIEKGRHESVMYLHPSTLARYGDVERVAVLVYANGQLLGVASSEGNERWWEQLSPRDGYVLNRLETPFAMLGFDNYEAIRGASGAR